MRYHPPILAALALATSVTAAAAFRFIHPTDGPEPDKLSEARWGTPYTIEWKDSDGDAGSGRRHSKVARLALYGGKDEGDLMPCGNIQEDADNFGRFQWIIKESRPSDGQGWECGAVDDRGNSRFAIKIWFDGDDVADEDAGHQSPLFNIVP